MSNTSKYASAKITGKQVGLVQARARIANLHGQALLEWLEFECDVLVLTLEDIPASRLDFILAKLARE